MTKIKNTKPFYDLEERTFQFAEAVGFSLKLGREQRQLLRTVNN